MKTPIIRKMNIEKRIKDLAVQYVPEWIYDEEDPDVGVVFSKVMEKMFEGTIRNFNKIPNNCYINFLNLLGTKLAPSISAKGMVTVEATKGSGGTYVKKGSFLYASSNESGKVFFETADAMYALDIGIDTIFYADGEDDIIIKVYEPGMEAASYTKTPFKMFFKSNENLQTHDIYIASSTLLLSKDKTIAELQINDSRSLENKKFLLEFFTNNDNISWQYYSNGEWNRIEKVFSNDGKLQMEFDGVSDMYDFAGRNERFLRCSVKNIPNDGLRLTDISMATKASDILPDVTLCNMTELSTTDFFPFGDELTTYTDFYIASDEAFTKKDASISIDIEMQFLEVEIENGTTLNNVKYKSIMDKSDFEEPEQVSASILKVTWEYWNGLGWSKLYKDASNEDFFVVSGEKIISKKLEFKCPGNLEHNNVGPIESHFIRARITKLKNPYNSFQKFIAPYIHDVKISYSYDDNFVPCEEIIVRSDLEEKVIDLTRKGTKDLLKNTLLPDPVMYICFTTPIDKGPFKILFNIEDTLCAEFPSIQWEYYSTNDKGINEWQFIQVLDNTEKFKHSGIVTLMGRPNFKKTKIFGKEGYFIRIINTDREYKNRKNNNDFPQINGMYANTVTVIQKETRVPEYFATDKFDENKVCNLAKPNIINARVWVNEINSLPAEVEEAYIEKEDGDKIRVERDEKGKVYALWIEWEEISSIKSADVNQRVFEVSYSEGLVTFGNGVHGKIPPYQEANGVMVLYSISQGKEGNIEKDNISGFTDSVSYISNVHNLKPIGGGINQETTSQAAERMATSIAGMNRIISLDDFEYAVCSNNRNVYKMKCVPHIDYMGNSSPGTISIAVLPRQYMQGYEKFSLLKEDIYKFIEQKAPVTMVGTDKIDIFEVSYVEISVSLDIVVTDYDYCHDVHKEVTDLLSELLNPITGNFDHKGWDIGRIATKEQIYNTIKLVKHIKWVRQANLFTKIVTVHGKKDVDFDNIKNDIFIVPICGEIEVNMSVDDEENTSVRR